MMVVGLDEGSPAMDFDDIWGNMKLPSDFPKDSELDNLRFSDALSGVQTSEEVPWKEIPGSGVVSSQNKFESLEAERAYSGGFMESGWSSGVVNCVTVEPSSYVSQGNDLFCRHDVLWTEDQISGFSGVPSEDNFETSVSWRASSDGSHGPSEISVFPYGEMLEPSSWICQGNGLFDMHADGGSQNVPSCNNESEKAPFDLSNHRVRFNFDVSNHVFHNQQSTEKNGGDKAPFETRSYGETPFLHGFDHVIHMQDSSDFSHLKHQDDLVGSTESYAMTGAGNELREPSNTLPNDYSYVQGHIKVKKNIYVIPSCDIVSRDSEVVDGAIYGGSHEPSSSKCLPLVSCKDYSLRSEDEAEDIIFESRRALPPLSVAGGTPIKRSVSAARDQHSTLHVSECPGVLPSPSVKPESVVQKTENEVSKSEDGCLLKINHQGVQNNTCCQSNVNNDSDLCILENISAPAPSYRIAITEKLGTKILTSSSPGNQIVTTNARHKPNNERVIFRVALQDLSQPKSEATPPDGVLSVPLLKHQRIALSWMANKETKSACCAGGILADDQGLGKTISTIALILKERSPSSKAPRTNVKQSETETLNLDDDIDDVSGAEGAEPNGCIFNSGNEMPLPAKGRPSGGTLIVCPTSILRQWSEELHSKVTGNAYLSVLLYYGSNRTKDPLELAKYDVVVTTYAIVTMEVPKQPVVNENDDHIGCSYKDSLYCGKRKIVDTISVRKSSMSKKSRKGIYIESTENVSGPLAQVRWFRVVLDEAQSIKNHRTQVARACWGLRAKRRWCLSGTPIQNAIDDLYSYFRFLRHEPYAVFRTFCEQVKVPIHRNPRSGYKKLQAVLKTVMLRRTKGTLIDGQPIINLPPKTIQLRKIDFSKEERKFYSRLEADSRAQFAEYAAAGTVKQNYVNILLMLLRLRQACDHPLLVKGFSSRSKIDSSVEVAKKHSREKQDFLLSCLEASLAICGVCNDPPEDAVVTLCGHVFCNQCICEHITGDDTQCPTKKCKTHLTKSCVFSTTTLRMALSDKPSAENTANLEVADPHGLICPQDSSKIRAALDILSSLTTPQDSSENSHVDDNSTSEEMNRESGGGDKVVGEKAIVFSQWTGMLDLLEACLKSSSIQYRRLDGTMAVAARDRAVKDFTSLPEVSVMIMSLKAASLGLNMVAACNVLLLDLWWNPTTEDQAIDRAHRIGQTRPVSVFRLTVKDTVEDRILALQQKKRKMVAYAFGEDKTGSRQSRLTVEDLKYLFRVD